MNREIKNTLILWLSLCAPLAHAADIGGSAGLSLLELAGARGSSLSNAVTALTDDITSFNNNPSALNTLASYQASFLHQSGSFDDRHTQLHFGGPLYNKANIGLSIGYFDGGEIELFDGTNTNNVKVRTDLIVNLGAATQMGRFDVGGAVKILSSELAEQEKASAISGDLGLQTKLTSRIRFGAAVQNLGTKLKFIDEGDNLPRLVRAGLATNLVNGPTQATLYLDGIRLFNEDGIDAAVGLEVMVSLLSLRGGYKTGSELEKFSAGAGLQWKQSSIDYSLQLVDELSERHLISFSSRFGDKK